MLRSPVMMVYDWPPLRLCGGLRACAVTAVCHHRRRIAKIKGLSHFDVGIVCNPGYFGIWKCLFVSSVNVSWWWQVLAAATAVVPCTPCTLLKISQWRNLSQVVSSVSHRTLNHSFSVWLFHLCSLQILSFQLTFPRWRETMISWTGIWWSLYVGECFYTSVELWRTTHHRISEATAAWSNRSCARTDWLWCPPTVPKPLITGCPTLTLSPAQTLSLWSSHLPSSLRCSDLPFKEHRP